MKFTSHEEYGLRCLLQIGRRGRGVGVTIPEISRAEGLSTAYTAKLLRILRNAGFLKSARGQAGGYTLARPPEQIIIGDVLAELGGRLFEGDFCERHSGQEACCTHSSDCSIRSLWTTVQTAVDRVLSRTTLQDLLRAEESACPPQTPLVHIRPSGPRRAEVL
ncbi:MAG TPA: Rrf2 family transcriptional regulator [Bryobacteraceae bacterium]|nr:Rrf2 family transcriptional regulator [Bryobacteraceae bacterium]